MQDAQDNEVIDVQARVTGNGPNDDTLRTIGWISYIMHLVVAIGAVVPMLEPSMVLLLLALVLDLVKRSDAQGTWQQSHFDWRIRSVAWALVLYVVTSPLYLLLYFPGKVAWFFVSVWFLVRIVRGMMALNQRQPVR